MTSTVDVPTVGSGFEGDTQTPTVESTHSSRLQQVITALLLVGPLVGVAVAIVALFGRDVTVLDLVMAAVLYALTGHGVTAGFHRMMAHRGFTATRGTKIFLGVAGSLAFEGALISWVANHRCHHAYTDVAGDPHSPYLDEHATWPRLRGALHAHVGWLFTEGQADLNRWTPDLLGDPDLVTISRLFPLFCVISLALPTAIAWGVTGTASGALGGFIWGGLVRVFVLQHVTFAVNSACHLWGKRPFMTRPQDRATNFAPLALFSMGESWHNLHHSNPTFACHGVCRGQLDSTAWFIRVLERCGRVSNVRWPSAEVIESRRREGSLAQRGVRRQFVSKSLDKPPAWGR